MGTENIHFDNSRRQSQERRTSRAWFTGVRTRQSLARELRRAAASTERCTKIRGCQVPPLLDRVTAVRSELLELASELEHGSDHHALQVALVRELLRDGAGPLYNPNVPVSNLHDMLSRARDAGRQTPGPASGAPRRNRLNKVRWSISAVGATGLAIVFGLAGPAGAAKSKQHTFSENVIAASITPDGSNSVAKITDSVDGPGAGTATSVSTSTSYPFKGTDTNISYFANGIQRSTDTFTIEKPDANGISQFTAKGKCTGRTRKHKNVKCTFTESGTVDTNPGGVAKIKVVGTYSG